MRALVLLRGALLGPALLLAACAGGTERLGPAADGRVKPAPRATAPEAREPASLARPDADAADGSLGELDRRLALWDEAQAEGRLAEADRIRGDLVRRIDAESDLLVAAARGSRGQGGVYVATMALAFATRRDATAVLVERLGDPDPRLVSNALLALKLRADPATPLEPIVAHLGSSSQIVRRHAPLALAYVLAARRAARVPADPALEARAQTRLVATLRDGDPLVRLHNAKAFAEITLPDATEALLAMLDDTSERVRLGAAAGLAQRGSRPGFERSVHLLHEMREEAKPLMAAVLGEHAATLQGAPLTPAQVQHLGTSAPAWAQWYAQFIRSAPATQPKGG
jgi:HEAT repeat protein